MEKWLKVVYFILQLLKTHFPPEGLKTTEETEVLEVSFWYYGILGNRDPQLLLPPCQTQLRRKLAELVFQSSPQESKRYVWIQCGEDTFSILPLFLKCYVWLHRRSKHWDLASNLPYWLLNKPEIASMWAFHLMKFRVAIIMKLDSNVSQERRGV